LDEPAAAILKKTLEGLGIVVHTNKDTRAIRGHDHVTGLEFKNGARLSCDLVVIAAGIKANSGLALRAGLVVPLWEQAKVLAAHLTSADADAAYHGTKVATKLKVMGVEVASMGITEPTEEGDEVVQFTEAKKGTYKKLIIRNGRLVGGILLGDIRKAPFLSQAYERNTPVPDERLSLLFDIGAPSEE